MKEQNHIICREVLELTVSDRGRAISIQNRIAELVRQKLHPALDQVFSGIACGENTIRIEKLELDIGAIGEKDLEHDFVKRIIEKVEEQMGKLLKSGGDKTRQSSFANGSEDKLAGVRVVSQTQDVPEQFLYFLCHGYFPWWHRKTEADVLEDIFPKVLGWEKESLKKLILPALKESVVRKRMIFQLDHKQLDALFQRLDEERYESLYGLFQVVLSLVQSEQHRRFLVDNFYHVFIQHFCVETSLSGEDQKITFLKEVLDLRFVIPTSFQKELLLVELFRNVLSHTKKAKKKEEFYILRAVFQAAMPLSSCGQALLEIVQKTSGTIAPEILELVDHYTKELNRMPSEVLGNCKQLLEEGDGKIDRRRDQKVSKRQSKEVFIQDSPQVSKDKEVEDQCVERKSSTITGELQDDQKEKLPVAGKAPRQLVQTATSREKIARGKSQKQIENTFLQAPLQVSSDVEEIFISNAGLVLFHPFLRYFFDGLNLLDKELQFKSREDAFRAVYLLQFIATGRETAPEYDMVLNKILCGLQVWEPVPKDFPLLDEEKEECVHLIKMVLERWEALKTSRPEALRDTYIRRDGILKQGGQGWNLMIERHTFDVMLEKLPWAISIIKFPWSSKILYVEW